MRTGNFPAKKYARQMRAVGIEPTKAQLEQARSIRTKKDRSSLGFGR